MTPEEKAIELYGKYHMAVDKVWFSNEEVKIKAKQLALIAVDEILNILPFDSLRYWSEVRTEIQAL